MNHHKRYFRPDPMTVLFIVVVLGVALTMLAQAGESPPAPAVVAGLQAAGH